MKKIFICICALFLFCMSCFAEETDRWIQCYQDNERSVVFDVQSFTITQDGSILVWEKTSYVKPLFKYSKKDVYSDLCRVEYKRDGTFGHRTITYYNKSGKTMANHTYDDGDIKWNGVPPGSIAEEKLKFYFEFLKILKETLGEMKK